MLNHSDSVYCISPNVGRYFGLVTGPPPPPAMEAMETAAAMEAATERFRRLFVCYLRKKKNFREYVGLSVYPNVCLFSVC